MSGVFDKLLGDRHLAPLPDLRTLRSRVVRLALNYILIFTLPVLAVGLYRSIEATWTWYMNVQVVGYLVLLYCHFSLPRLSTRLVALVIVWVVVLVGVSGIAGWGPAPSRFVVLSVGCILSALFNGGRIALVTLVGSTLLVCLAAVLNPLVAIIDGGDSVSEHNPLQWLVTISSFTFYTACCSLLVAWVAGSLQKTIVELRNRETDLQHSNEMLRGQTVKLEEQAATLEEQAEDLVQQRNRADSALLAKDRFLSVITHELRTPLNPILGFIDLMKDEESRNSESREQLELMRKSGEHLLQMIDKVVDFSELDKGEFVLKPKKTSLEALRLAVDCRLSLEAKERGLDLFVSSNGALESNIFLDERRTLQIVEELGVNALKFTPKGSVNIEFSVVDVSNSRGRLQISVKDTGGGMEKSSVESLFDPFVQEDCSRTRKIGGFGIGLAACEALVAAMGGSISVESKVGAGSEFVVAIPVQVEAARSTRVESRKGRSRFNRPVSVLVAEDDLMNQKVISALLKRLGASVHCVADGQRAIAALEEAVYDVVLMDLSMPVLDGIDATREIRKIERMKDTPIIALTAHSFAKCEEECFEAGMNGFLTKPAKADKIYLAISEVLSGKVNSKVVNLPN